MPRFRSNNKELENAFNYLLARIEGKKNPEMSMGKGMFSPHTDDNHIVIETRGGLGGGGGGGCKRWVPRIGADDSGKPTLTFKDGAINGVFADNIHEPISYTLQDQLQYIVADITADDEEGITNFDIAVVTEAADAILEEGAGSPPSPAKFLLGGILGSSIYMTVCSNLSARAYETRRSAREPDFLGGEPFDRYYRWDIVQASEPALYVLGS